MVAGWVELSDGERVAVLVGCVPNKQKLSVGKMFCGIAVPIGLGQGDWAYDVVATGPVVDLALNLLFG